MIKRNNIFVYTCALVVCLLGCTGKNITGKFYTDHRLQLDTIKETYTNLRSNQRFAISFSDKAFRTVTLEIHTDSLRYIYDFEVNGTSLADSLKKFRMDVAGTKRLIGLMQSIKCTWVNRFDYYVDGKEKELIMISVKPKAFKPLFRPRKYYILTYYSQPQRFDSDGRLLDKRRSRQLRKINGEIFHRINDTICYSVSEQFR